MEKQGLSSAKVAKVEKQLEKIKQALEGSKFVLNTRSRRGFTWIVRSPGWVYRLTWDKTYGWVLTPSNSSRSFCELNQLVRQAAKGR